MIGSCSKVHSRVSGANGDRLLSPNFSVPFVLWPYYVMAIILSFGAFFSVGISRLILLPLSAVLFLSLSLKSVGAPLRGMMVRAVDGRLFSRAGKGERGTLRVLMYPLIADDPGQDILAVFPRISEARSQDHLLPYLPARCLLRWGLDRPYRRALLQVLHLARHEPQLQYDRFFHQSSQRNDHGQPVHRHAHHLGAMNFKLVLSSLKAIHFSHAPGAGNLSGGVQDGNIDKGLSIVQDTGCSRGGYR